MRKLAVVNMKGGVGKTTTAVHLAAGLARRGARVLLIDADPQGNVAHTLRLRPTRSFEHLMTGEATLADVTLPAVRPNLDVVAATPAAFALERRLGGETQRETILARRLRHLHTAGAASPSDSPRYDAVVVDCSPAMNLLTYNALLFAEEIVVPVSMDLMAVIGARQTLQGVEQVRELWPERRLDLLAVLPTFVHSGNHATRATFDALEQDAGIASRLIRPGIRQCIDLNYSTASHQTIWEYAPKSRAAADYSNFIDFVEGTGTSSAYAQASRRETASTFRSEGVSTPADGTQTQAEI